MKHIISLVVILAAVSVHAENRAYCKIANTNATQIVYAPDYVWPKWTTPTASDYLAAGWLKNAITSPTNRVGMMAHLNRYEARGDAVFAVYSYIPVPIAIPRYSLADLTFWAVGKGKMDAVSSELKALGYYEVYLTTQEVSADNELFMPTLKIIAAKVGLTDADVKEALAYALIGGAE